MIAKHKAGKGFSLVEVVIALAVLTFGAYGIYARFYDSGRMSRLHYDQERAYLLAAAEMERLRACPAESLRAWRPSPDPEPWSGQLRFNYQDSVQTGENGLLNLSVKVGWDVGSNGFEDGKVVEIRGLVTP